MNRTRWIVAIAAVLTVVAAALSYGKRSERRPPIVGIKVTPPVGSGPLAMTAALSHGMLLVGGDGRVYLDVAMTGSKAEGARPRVTAALVIDQSDSMRGDKLENAKLSALRLLEALHDGDRVVLIGFATEVEVLAEATTLRADTRADLRSRILEMQTRDSTNIGEALLVARAQLAKVLDGDGISRVVLISDGVPKKGLMELGDFQLLARENGALGMPITTIGLGLDYNEDIMRAISEHSAANYYYVKNSGDLSKAVETEVEALAATVAKRTQVTLTLAPGVEIDRVFGYPYGAEGRSVTIDVGNVHGGQTRHVVVRLRVPAETEGERAVTAVEVASDDALGPVRGRRLGAALAVIFTRDAEAVRAARNKKVLARVEQVESAATLDDAMVRYQAGQIEEAQQMLQRRLSESSAANQELDDKELGASNGRLEQLMNQVNAAPPPSSAAGNDLGKRAKADAFDLTR